MLVYLKVDPKIQEQMGCWSKDSVSRQLYMARVCQTLVGIQRRIYKCDYDLMQDDFKFVDEGPRGPPVVGVQEQPPRSTQPSRPSSPIPAPAAADVNDTTASPPPLLGVWEAPPLESKGAFFTEGPPGPDVQVATRVDEMCPSCHTSLHLLPDHVPDMDAEITTDVDVLFASASGKYVHVPCLRQGTCLRVLGHC